MKRLGFIATILCATQAATAADETRRWDMPTAYSNFHTENAVAFAGCVGETTNKSIDITVRGGGEMLKGQAIYAALKAGNIEIGERPLSAHRRDHAIFGSDIIPFLATSYQDSEDLSVATEPAIRAALETENLHLLYSVPWQPVGLTVQKTIDSFADMKGLRQYAYSHETARFAELAGMIPSQPEVDPISQALFTNALNALLTRARTAVDQGFRENASHHYLINAWFPRNSVLLNLDTWRALTSDERDALTTCSAEAAMRGARLSRENNNLDLAALRDTGMVVAAPGDALLADFIRKIGEPILTEWLEKADHESNQAVTAYRDSIAE